MATENPARNDTDYHSAPIPIGASRRRAMSVSSSDSSPSSPPIQTPLSAYPPKVATASPSTSPLLSYFMGSSPTKANATFPLRRPSAAPVFEEDEGQDVEVPASVQGHRRATSAWSSNGRFPQQQAPPPSVAASQQQERGVGVLRRLSLGGGFGRPTLPPLQRATSPPPLTAPPPSAVTPSGDGSAMPASPMRKARRSATVSARSPDRRRAPSPMGERILKGHFDGFN